MDNAFVDDDRTGVAALLAPWLLKLVDPYDWGYRRPDGSVTRNLTNAQLEAFRNREHERWPQKLGQKLVLAHLRMEDELHYTSSRRSGFALLTLDVDAHKGQGDAFEAVELLRGYFPGCYIESSPRGYHVFLLVCVGRFVRRRFNELLVRFRGAALDLLVENNITSTVEVKAEFTTFLSTDVGFVLEHRASMCRLPRPANISQARALVDSPAYTPEDLEAFITECQYPHQEDVFLLEANEIAPRNNRGDNHGLDEGNALHRMYITFFRFTVREAREPDLDELLGRYEIMWDAGPSHARRKERGQWVLDHSRFDAAKAKTSGYEKQREGLLALVREHVKPHHTHGLSYVYGISDEDLAVALWVVTSVSFQNVEDKRKQFGCPNKRLLGAFAMLREAGVIERGCKMSTKISSIKVVLQRAELIQCLDHRFFFVPGRPDLGRGKKYAIGRNHPQFAEWSSLRPELERRRAA